MRNNLSVKYPCSCSLSASTAEVLSAILGLFVRLISHQPAVLFSQNKPATSNQPAVLFSQNKSASAISHQPNEQCVSRMLPIVDFLPLSFHQRQDFLQAAVTGNPSNTLRALDKAKSCLWILGLWDPAPLVVPLMNSLVGLDS
jgi:hypothetical protein